MEIKTRHGEKLEGLQHMLVIINKLKGEKQYTKQKGKNISGAENSAINEIYNQLSSL